MKKALTLATILAGSLGATANAASPDWTGAYAGAQIGFADGEADVVFNTKNEDGDFWALEHDLDGTIGAVHVGYDRQAGLAVFGVHAGVSFLEIDGSRTNPQDGSNYIGVNGPKNGPPVQLNTELNRIFTLQARAGYLLDPKFLAHIHGGLAVGEFELSGSGGPANDFSPQEDWKTGFVAGIGGEYLVTDNISLTLDYTNYNFDDPDLYVIADGSDYKGAINNQGRDFDVISIGANFRFSNSGL